MLSLEEREIAERALALAIMNADRPRSALVSMVNETDFGLDFPLTPQSVRDLAREAIKMCEASQWERVPPWLQQILSKVADTPEIKKILAKIQTPPLTWQLNTPDPFETLWLPRLGLPFLNRLKLRESFRRLDAPTGSSVLIINGPPKSGKSYSVELLYHVAQERAAPAARGVNVPVGLITLQRGMGASLSPEALAQMITTRINSNPKPLPQLNEADSNVTPDRMNVHLCKWIIDNVNNTGEKWWLVLDGLNDPDLTPISRNFISKLVEMLSTGPYSKALRLVIIDYPADLLAGVNPDQMESERLGPIGEVDVELFLRQQLGKAGGALPSRQAVQAGVILTMLNLPEDDMRLKVLNDRLKAVVENLSKVNGNA